MASGGSDPKKMKSYELPWNARVGRWFRLRREMVSLLIIGGVTLAGGAAFLAGQPRLGAMIAVIGLLYIAYAYTNWFNGLN